MLKRVIQPKILPSTPLPNFQPHQTTPNKSNNLLDQSSNAKSTEIAHLESLSLSTMSGWPCTTFPSRAIVPSRTQCFRHFPKREGDSHRHLCYFVTGLLRYLLRQLLHWLAKDINLPPSESLVMCIRSFYRPQPARVACIITVL